MNSISLDHQASWGDFMAIYLRINVDGHWVAPLDDILDIYIDDGRLLQQMNHKYLPRIAILSYE